jgi:beta-lactamase superfamily II metal-dependent hydrolase
MKNITVKFIKAFQGDCILLSFKDSNNSSKNILIDGGMDGTYYDTPSNLYGELKKEIDCIRNKKENIDLLVLTHIDNDHIRGLLKWFEMDDEAYLMIKNVWFNSGKLIAEYFNEPENNDLKVGLNIFSDSSTGVHEAIDFEKYLIEKNIWKRALVTQSTVLEKDGIKIQILSPSEAQLKKLLKEYVEKTEDNAYTSGREKDWNVNLESFIREEEKKGVKFIQDSSVTNGSSIAFILTVQEKKFLFLADSPPKEIVNSLNKLGYSKENPVEVEFLKVSHHGSKGNTTKELLEIIKTDNYVISTDSSSYGHPDKRVLSRIISANPKAIFHFNYTHVKDGIFSDKDFSDFKYFKAKVTSEYCVNYEP